MPRLASKPVSSPELPFGLKLTKKGLGDVAKLVSGTTSTPLVISDDTEADIYTCILLTRKNPSIDPAMAATALAQLTDFPIDHFGSHTLKVPDANMVSDRSAFFGLPTPEGIAGVVGVTSAVKRRVSGIGNADKTPYYRFLGAVYRDGQTGEVLSVLDDLLRDGRIIRAIRRLPGRNNKLLNDLIKVAETVAKRRSGCDVDTIGAENKVILWPLADNDYVALTPTTNLALLMEIKERVDVRKNADANVFFPDRAIKIGGTKPQNAGVVASDRAGWFRLLACDPPPIRSRPLHMRGIDEKLNRIKLCRFLPGNERTRMKRDKLIAEIVDMVARHLQQGGSVVNHPAIMTPIRARAVAADLNDYEYGRFADQINAFILDNRS